MATPRRPRSRPSVLGDPGIARAAVAVRPRSRSTPGMTVPIGSKRLALRAATQGVASPSSSSRPEDQARRQLRIRRRSTSAEGSRRRRGHAEDVIGRERDSHRATTLPAAAARASRARLQRVLRVVGSRRSRHGRLVEAEDTVRRPRGARPGSRGRPRPPRDRGFENIVETVPEPSSAAKAGAGRSGARGARQAAAGIVVGTRDLGTLRRRPARESSPPARPASVGRAAPLRITSVDREQQAARRVGIGEAGQGELEGRRRGRPRAARRGRRHGSRRPSRSGGAHRRSRPAARPGRRCTASTDAAVTPCSVSRHARCTAESTRLGQVGPASKRRREGSGRACRSRILVEHEDARQVRAGRRAGASGGRPWGRSMVRSWGSTMRRS